MTLAIDFKAQTLKNNILSYVIVKAMFYHIDTAEWLSVGDTDW